MNIAILGTSKKENERRLPIHPGHFSQISPALRARMIFEEGYGEPFGVSDTEITAQFGGVMARHILLEESDLVVLAKPAEEDVASLKHGATLWGWIHCVQNPTITQIAIDKKLTFITWESMNKWDESGNFQSHVFSVNNQIAGYAGVIHALTLRGMEGIYGPSKKIVLINTGQVSVGAMRALASFGFSGIHVVSARPSNSQDAVFQQATFYELLSEQFGSLQIQHNEKIFPLMELLQDADVIINGILQNPLQPLMFVQPDEENLLKPGCLIIDISCDTAMGFPFSRATSFDEPLLNMGKVFYYAVDHTPSLLWQSATWAISKALLPFWQTIISGEEAVKDCPVLSRAIEINQGHILHQGILQFQNREKTFPHKVISRP